MVSGSERHPSLDGRWALVTGAAKRIGAVIADAEQGSETENFRDPPCLIFLDGDRPKFWPIRLPGLACCLGWLG